MSSIMDHVKSICSAVAPWAVLGGATYASSKFVTAAARATHAYDSTRDNRQQAIDAMDVADDDAHHTKMNLKMTAQRKLDSEYPSSVTRFIAERPDFSTAVMTTMLVPAAMYGVGKVVQLRQ